MCVAKGGVYGKCGGLTKMEVLKRFLRDEGFVILGAVLALIGARGHMIKIFTKMANDMINAAGEVSGGS